MSMVRLLLALVALLVCAPAAGAATRGIELGFFDTANFTSDPVWLDRAESLGAGVVRVSVSWPGVAPTKPTDPTNPNDPVYRWEATDRFVAAAAARGMIVLLSVEQAPAWAEARGRPRRVRQGTWRPNVKALGRFMEAVARRYSGRVRYFQVWNEPNLDHYLAPQWRRVKGRWRPDAAPRYRRMLNASHAAIRRVSSHNRLVTGGTAPYGDPIKGGRRTMPVRFWRTVLRKRVRFDVLAHHPYGVGSPRRKALNRDDVAVPDLGKLRRLTKKPLWVTEISWDSNRPDPEGVPELTHARWLADSFFVLWKSGVRAVTWFQIRDQAPVPSYAATLQSGVYFRDGRPKLAAQAFAFPFACERAGRRVRVWMKAPAAGPVDVLDRRGRVVRQLRAGASRVVMAKVPTAHRARQGDQLSISCQVQ
jgi:hypothetical protein